MLRQVVSLSDCSGCNQSYRNAAGERLEELCQESFHIFILLIRCERRPRLHRREIFSRWMASIVR